MKSSCKFWGIITSSIMPFLVLITSEKIMPKNIFMRLQPCQLNIFNGKNMFTYNLERAAHV